MPLNPHLPRSLPLLSIYPSLKKVVLNCTKTIVGGGDKVRSVMWTAPTMKNQQSWTNYSMFQVHSFLHVLVGNAGVVSYQLTLPQMTCTPRTCWQVGKMLRMLGQYVIKFCQLDHAKQNDISCWQDVIQYVSLFFRTSRKIAKLCRKSCRNDVIWYVKLAKRVSYELIRL